MFMYHFNLISHGPARKWFLRIFARFGVKYVRSVLSGSEYIGARKVVRSGMVRTTGQRCCEMKIQISIIENRSLFPFSNYFILHINSSA
jgi:hypothetical protein